MSHLRFDFNWRKMLGGPDAAISSCMADLAIYVDGNPVTRVFDAKSRTTRDSILVSLYPLAEWIAAHWWPLLEENLASREDLDVYYGRHSVDAVGDGFAWPDFAFVPEGDTVLLQWCPRKLQHQELEFISTGDARLPKEEVGAALGSLVEAVLGRLDSLGIPGDSVAEEWGSIARLDAEETEFCRSAGRMGLDPFDLEPSFQQSIIAAVKALPSSLTEELLRSVSARTIIPAQQWVNAGIERIKANDFPATLRRFEAFRPTPLTDPRPWQQGYTLARQFRTFLGTQEQVPFDFDAVLESPLRQCQVRPAPLPTLLGVVADDPQGRVGCYTARTNQRSGRFLVARALGVCLEAGHTLPALLTQAVTEKQKRNRAFAAELLAPIGMIRERLLGDEVSPEQIEELSDLFDVSEWVLTHQIENHRLARIAID